MYKLVASDMDGTFLSEAHTLIPANVEAVHRMRALGILFVPASGRPYPSVMSSLEGMRDVLEGSYVISLNGAFIHRVGDAEPIFGSQLDADAAAGIWSHGRELDLCMHVYTASGGYYVANLSEDEREWLQGLGGIIDLGPAPADLSFAGDDPVVKILYQSEDYGYVKRLGAQMSASRLDLDKVSVTYSSDRYVEFMPAGVSKGAGLTRLAEHLGIDMAETVAVGDAANDVDMVRAAGLGVGVGNATSELAPHCDAVLETGAYDGAFPELVERYLEPAACG